MIMRRIVVALAALAVTVTAVAKPVEVSFAAADGVRVYGDVYASAAGKTAPTILLFHQAGGDARGEYLRIAIRLLDEGYNVIAVDQRSGGDRFGGENRTVAALDNAEFGYCDAYPDLEAALTYAREAGFSGPLAVWGSSYSAALVFQLGAKNAQEVDAILGFSPAAGPPLADCALRPYLEDLAVSALALRPRREYEIESVRKQMEEFDSVGVQTYVADPGVHGSSMLSDERVQASTEATWTVVLEFLKANLREN